MSSAFQSQSAQSLSPFPRWRCRGFDQRTQSPGSVLLSPALLHLENEHKVKSLTGIQSLQPASLQHSYILYCYSFLFIFPWHQRQKLKVGAAGLERLSACFSQFTYPLSLFWGRLVDVYARSSIRPGLLENFYLWRINCDCFDVTYTCGVCDLSSVKCITCSKIWEECLENVRREQHFGWNVNKLPHQ